MEIYLNLSSVSSYPNQIILYRSLHTCWQLILEFIIQKILYSGSLLIITGIRASCVLLRKELNVAGLSMDIQKTEWIEHMDSGRQRVNDSVPGWEMIL